MSKGNEALMEIFTPVIESVIAEKMDDMDITQKIKDEFGHVAQHLSKTLIVNLSNTGVSKKMGIVHKDFADLLEVVASGENVLLYGGAGTGKTTAVLAIAEALGLNFRAVSFSSQTTESKLVGYNDAYGKYHPSAIVEAMIAGDVLLLDEFDAGEAGVIVGINSLIDNGFIDTPNGVVYAHENFRIVACANTALNGATKTYNGRKKLDGATENRFDVMEWGIDLDMVKAFTDNNDWYEIVLNVMNAVNEQLDNVLITPRNFYSGARKLRNTKLSFERIVGLTLFKGLDTDSRQVIQNAIDEKQSYVQAIKGKIATKKQAVIIEPEPKAVEPEPEAVEPEPQTEPLGDW